MSKYLITPSLINSFQYYIKDEWKSPADSRADFLKTLSRERFKPNEAMQKGIDFENNIELACKDEFPLENPYEYKTTQELVGDFMSTMQHCVGGPNQYEKIVLDISKIVKKGIWQATCKKDLVVRDTNLLLYGRCDVIKTDTIYDIKYTSKYDTGKFNESIQHLIYMYCLDVPKFAYLVSDGKSFWREDYFADNLKFKIKCKINDFLQYLERDKEASNIFYEKWKAQY